MAGNDPWPEDVRLWRGKMYLKDSLCVPSGLGARVIGAHKYLCWSYGSQKTCQSSPP